MNEINQLQLRQLKGQWHWYLALGIALNILGSLAIIFAYFSTLFSIVYLGILLITLGLFEGIKAITLHPISQFLLHLLLGILCILAGLSLIFSPTISAINITLLLALLFIVSGILKIIFSLRPTLHHRIWLLINGILTLILGLLIWHQWPVSGLWVIGMFVGVNMLLSSWNLILLSFAIKNAKTE